MAMRRMPDTSDRQRMPLEPGAGLRRRRLHDLDRFGDDFEADIVAEQNADAKARHVTGLSASRR
jgi:hypothetical protein